MRREGHIWIAYYALPDTMEGAILLGSIAMRFVENNEERKEAFMGMMRDAVTELLKERTGAEDVTWPDGPQPAPEHERSGSA